MAPIDPFSGLDILRVRYAAGGRPSSDISGLALSWLLTGEKRFADKALGQMTADGMPAKPGSGNWVQFANWALAYDWLYGYPDFDPKLKDRLAAQFTDVAAVTVARPELTPPSQASFQNYPTRYLGLAVFTLCAASKHRPDDAYLAQLKSKTVVAFRNMLQLTRLVVPCGSYHESMDYMRISYLPMAMLAELQRTRTGVDPARRFSMYANFGDTYLYKLLPDGTPSREGDNEYPILDDRDTAALGYAVHRFKDPYAAWLLRDSGFPVRKWALPVLDFLWDDPDVVPRDPSATAVGEIPLCRHFPGVDQVVFRGGWGSSDTRIEFDCGPYFAKHQHLDRGHFTIYRRGHLAIDSGADYTETESPHYLNYYRRTVAHNSMLVFDPSEKFFWGEDVVQAANDGGQRMDSSRFWNTVRSLEDWEKTRDLWDLGHLRIVDASDKYNYALGDATRAYSPRKVSRFTRQLLYLPALDVLLVFDRVVSTGAAFRKAWLLHAVNEPSVEGQSAGDIGHGGEEFPNAPRFRIQEGDGEILVHTLLPAMHSTTRRGGPEYEFWTPGNSTGGAWGTGRNWPVDPAEGGPLPTEPDLRAMWKKFWGPDCDRIERSNRRNVIPGAWRIEVSPAHPAKEDLFLH
ncbi:MAG: heparinase II/III domain-containing protein, partial [Acidobacteriaceae bacterium]